jgi:hypothetical protein
VRANSPTIDYPLSPMPRLWTVDSGLYAPDFGLWTLDGPFPLAHRMGEGSRVRANSPTIDYPLSPMPRLWTVDSGQWTVCPDFGPWTLDFGLRRVDCGLWTVDCGLQQVSTNVTCIYAHLRASTRMFFF